MKIRDLEIGDVIRFILDNDIGVVTEKNNNHVCIYYKNSLCTGRYFLDQDARLIKFDNNYLFYKQLRNLK